MDLQQPPPATPQNIMLEFSGQLTTSAQRAGKRESVRSQIALYYVIGFLIIILIAILIGWAMNFKVTDYKDMLIAISGILSGPLGFIIGFYFKESSNDKSQLSPVVRSVPKNNKTMNSCSSFATMA